MIKTIKINDIEMDYMVFGNGKTPLVVIPGLSIHSVMPAESSIINRYTDGIDDYTFYVFDRKKNATKGYSIKQMADDTALVLKEIGIKSCCLFGTSQGGMIAQFIAANYPELVDKMALCSTLYKTNSTVLNVVNSWIDLAKSHNAVELSKDSINKVYSKNTVEKFGELLISANLNITQYEFEQFIIMASSINDFSMEKDINKIKCKTTVIGCKGDNVTTAQGSIELANALNCECYLYDENYGHGVYDEADDFPQRLFNCFK